MIPVNEPLLDGNEEKYLTECIRSGWISSEGPLVDKFEQQLATRVGCSYGVAVCNGTAALDVAIEAIGIGPGDEVILPTFTIISCVHQIVRAGATPVLIDSDMETWNMDVSKIRGKITERTRAIMVVHIYGLPVDMDPVLEIAREFDLVVIEDASEMLGQTYKGQNCGALGDISTFSFYPNKHVTTGEGGMVVTNNEQLAEKSRSLRNLCFQPKKRFVHERLGWNYRMTSMQAAIGIAQLERLDEFVERKRLMGARYQELLAGCENVQLPVERTSYAENIYWVFGLVLDKSTGLTGDSMMNRLTAKGIGCRPFFVPMHRQPVLRNMGLFEGQEYPVADLLCQQGVYIPSGLALTTGQIDEVARTVKEVLS